MFLRLLEFIATFLDKRSFLTTVKTIPAVEVVLVYICTRPVSFLAVIPQHSTRFGHTLRYVYDKQRKVAATSSLHGDSSYST